MPKTIIHHLAKSTDDEVLKLQSRPMRLARLKSLQTDPTHFTSKYEHEVKQEEEFWLARLRPAHVQHFAVLTTDNDQTDSTCILFDDSTVFHGFMVVTNEYEEETTDAANAGRLVDQKVMDEIPTYFMAAFFVDQVLRSQGIGSRIIQASIDWVRKDGKAKGWPRVRYRVTALQGNDRAVGLYLRNGFKVDITNKQGDMADDIYTELSMIIET